MDADLFDDDPIGRAEPVTPAAHRRAWRRFDSLKLRLTLGILIALLIGMALTAWEMGSMAERDLIRQAQLREQRDAERTAALIGRRVGELQASLATVAAQLDKATLSDPGRLSAFLVGQPLLRSLFANVFATDADGRMIAYHDGAGARFPQTSLADRDYFIRAVTERRAAISRPLLGKVAKEPVLAFAHPVLAGDTVLGVLGGGLRLASRDLLDDLTGGQGKDDDVEVIVADAAGSILSHPQRARLLGKLDDETELASHFRMWRESGRPDNFADAGDLLVTVARDEVSGWYVWRNVRSADRLAPLFAARASTARHALGMAVLLSALLAAFVAWQLRPLMHLERRAAALLAGDGAARWPEASGEIGQLTRTLKHLWAERMQVEGFNAQVMQKLSSVLSAAPVGLAFTRHQRFELVSADLCRMMGRPESDLVGQPTQSIFASNADYASLGPQVAEAFGHGEAYAGEHKLLRSDGTEFWAEMRAQPVAPGDPSAGTIWSIGDVHQQVLARDELQHAARHDPLTGVANRAGFELELQQLFDGQPGSRPASLVMIDLDHFKPINDTAGHAAGDAMLVAVAQAIASRVRASDLVVRMGGDEFALLLRNCTHDRAVAVAEKVRGAIESLSLTWETHTLRVGASLGVVELGDDHASAAQWLAQADAACYEAKRAGRGTVRSSRTALRVLSGGAG